MQEEAVLNNFSLYLLHFYRSFSMKKIIAISAIAAAASFMAGNVVAADAPAAAPDPGPVTANVTLASQYRYRGISQTNSLPAIQGGFDYAHESGFYVGNWNSNISWINDGYGANSAGVSSTGVSAPIEMDFYAGFKKEVTEGLTLDGGILEYYYANKNLPNGVTYNGSQSTVYGNAYYSGRQAVGQSPNTTELYAAATYGFATFKYSYALTNLFGIDNSKGAQYFDLSLNYDTGFEGITLNGHVGYQYVPSTSVVSLAQPYEPNFSYTDWKIGLTKDFGHGLAGALAYIGTNASNNAYWSPTFDNTGKGTVVVSLTKTF
jgi:Bacterial protein of unknown function (Gcw_chp)